MQIDRPATPPFSIGHLAANLPQLASAAQASAGLAPPQISSKLSSGSTSSVSLHDGIVWQSLEEMLQPAAPSAPAQPTAVATSSVQTQPFTQAARGASEQPPIAELAHPTPSDIMPAAAAHGKRAQAATTAATTMPGQTLGMPTVQHGKAADAALPTQQPEFSFSRAQVIYMQCVLLARHACHYVNNL